MAWHATGSYVNGQFLEDSLANAVAFDLVQSSSTSFEVHLHTEGITGQDPDASEAYGSGAYATTYEVATSGDYDRTTPLVLDTTTLTSSSGKLIWDEGDTTMAWGGGSAVTWADGSAPIGCSITDSDNSDRLITAIKFGSDDIPVNNGTFTITWDATNGIWYADYRSDV